MKDINVCNNLLDLHRERVVIALKLKNWYSRIYKLVSASFFFYVYIIDIAVENLFCRFKVSVDQECQWIIVFKSSFPIIMKGGS